MAAFVVTLWDRLSILRACRTLVTSLRFAENMLSLGPLSELARQNHFELSTFSSTTPASPNLVADNIPQAIPSRCASPTSTGYEKIERQVMVSAEALLYTAPFSAASPSGKSTRALIACWPTTRTLYVLYTLGQTSQIFAALKIL